MAPQVLTFQETLAPCPGYGSYDSPNSLGLSFTDVMRMNQIFRRWWPRAVFLVLCGLVLTVYGGCAKPEWKEYANREGGYRILLPGTPQQETEAVKTLLGNLNLRKAKADLGSLVYMVIHVDLTPVMQYFPDKQLLDAAKQGMEDKGYQMNVAQELTLSGHPGVELRGQNATEGIYCRARIYRTKGRMYQVAVYSNAEDRVTDADADKLFASFKLQ